MSDRTAYDFLQRIAGDGNVFLRMKHEGDGRIDGRTVNLKKITDPAAFSAGLRAHSEQGWSVWAMVSETLQGDAPVRTRLLWADLDWDKYPRGKAQVAELISTLPVAPSLVVESGHGNHLYWYLDRALTPSQARELAKSMAWQLGGDPLYAPNHKMRVPGTVNPKHLGAGAAEKGYDRAVDCSVAGGTGAVHAPDAFPRDSSLEKLPHGVMKKLVRGPETPATIDKSAYDYQLALTLLENGLNQAEIEHLLTTYTASGKAATEGHNKRNYIQRTIAAAWKIYGAKGSPHLPTKEVTSVVWERKTYQQLLEAPRPSFLVEDFLPSRGMALIAAPPKARKSWAAMQLAHSMATGVDWLGFRVPEARKVLYVQAELPDDVVAARFEQMYGTAPVDNLQFIRVPAADLTLHDHLQGLLGQIDEFGAELVIIDPIANFWQGDENSASSVNALFDNLAQLQDRGCGVVLIHHSRKTQGMERITPQHMRGSSVFFARPDAIMTISPTLEGFSWADFTLRAAAPRDGVRLFVGNSGEFVLTGETNFDKLPDHVQEKLRVGAAKVRANKEKRYDEAGKQVEADLSELQLIQFDPERPPRPTSAHARADRTGVGVPGLRQNSRTFFEQAVPRTGAVSAGD